MRVEFRVFKHGQEECTNFKARKNTESPITAAQDMLMALLDQASGMHTEEFELEPLNIRKIEIRFKRCVP